MKLGDPIKLPTGIFSVLNLHIAGVALLVIVNIALVARLGVAWRDASSSGQDRLQQERLRLAQLRAETAKLTGLPISAEISRQKADEFYMRRIERSRQQADQFYARRIPANYSSMLAYLFSLAKTNRVRLTRSGYTQAPAIPGLTELRIDANLAGEYTDVIRFINGLETDRNPAPGETAAPEQGASPETAPAEKIPGKSAGKGPVDERPFFIIGALTLTGQQGGTVNLRLLLRTFLHAEDASQLPPSSSGEPAGNDAAPKAIAPGEQSMLRSPAERGQRWP